MWRSPIWFMDSSGLSNVYFYDIEDVDVKKVF